MELRAFERLFLAEGQVLRPEPMERAPDSFRAEREGGGERFLFDGRGSLPEGDQDRPFRARELDRDRGRLVAFGHEPGSLVRRLRVRPGPVGR